MCQAHLSIVKAKTNDIAPDLKVFTPRWGETGWQVIPSSAGRGPVGREALGRTRGTSHPILGQGRESSEKG